MLCKASLYTPPSWGWDILLSDRSRIFSPNNKAMNSLNDDCLLEILSRLEETDLARMRCVTRHFRTLVDSQHYPLHTMVDACREVYSNQENQRTGMLLIRFLMRSRIGFKDGLLVRRFRRWLSHKKNVSFGKQAFKFAKTIQKGSTLYDFLYTKYDFLMEKRAVDLFDAIKQYCITCQV